MGTPQATTKYPQAEPVVIDSIKRLIRDIPDFPTPGVLFRDITPLLADPAGLALAVELMTNPYRDAAIDVVVGAESRGFIFGTAIARSLNTGFIPVRKPGKLPGKTMRQEYELEYGTDALEIHCDAFSKGQNVLIVDDLLATGGTLLACRDLVRSLGGIIAGISVLIELSDLNGASKLEPDQVTSVLSY